MVGYRRGTQHRPPGFRVSDDLARLHRNGSRVVPAVRQDASGPAAELSAATAARGSTWKAAARKTPPTCSSGSSAAAPISCGTSSISDGPCAIVSQGSNKVLEVANSRGEDGTNIIQNHWNGGDDQRWRIERVGNGFFEIINFHSGKCMDVEGKKTENGANIQQWSCGGAPISCGKSSSRRLACLAAILTSIPPGRQVRAPTARSAGRARRTSG